MSAIKPRNVRIVGVIGEPESGKDFISTAIGWFFADWPLPYRVARLGRVLREKIGEKRFLNATRPEAPPEYDAVIEAMTRYALQKYGRIVVVGVPRNRRQVDFLQSLQEEADASLLIVRIKGKWDRDQSEDSTRLADRVRQTQYLDEVLSYINEVRIPLIEMWNYREIELPDAEAIRALDIPTSELWNAARPHVSGRAAT